MPKPIDSSQSGPVGRSCELSGSDASANGRPAQWLGWPLWTAHRGSRIDGRGCDRCWHAGCMTQGARASLVRQLWSKTLGRSNVSWRYAWLFPGADIDRPLAVWSCRSLLRVERQRRVRERSASPMARLAAMGSTPALQVRTSAMCSSADVAQTSAKRGSRQYRGSSAGNRPGDRIDLLSRRNTRRSRNGPVLPIEPCARRARPTSPRAGHA
jgi:hypothetical protein